MSGTVSWLVRRYVASRADITVKARQQGEWAILHIENGLGAIQLSRLDREDVATLRAALSEAVDEGLIPRSPAARFGLPRTVAKEVKPKDAVAWDAAEVDRFVEATAVATT